MIDARHAQAAIARSGALFAALLASADPAAPAPSCPGWSVRDLAVHLGETHRWAASAIHTARPDEPAPTAPADAAALPDWYLGTVHDLLGLLAGVAPDAPAWTFGPPATAAFWARRQAHELAVHLVDLGDAVGVEVGVEPEPALDGIDEVVTVFFPRQVRLGRTPPLTATLGLVPDDGDRRWMLAGDGTGPTSAPEAPGPEAATPDATLSGPAEALFLLLWGRRTLADPRIRLDGDPAAADAVLAARLVP